MKHKKKDEKSVKDKIKNYVKKLIEREDMPKHNK
jgi:hypothetical protein